MLYDYAPEMIAVEASRYPSMQAVADDLGGTVEILPVPIPLTCIDGFGEALYGPEFMLGPGARRANSAEISGMALGMHAMGICARNLSSKDRSA